MQKQKRIEIHKTYSYRQFIERNYAYFYIFFLTALALCCFYELASPEIFSWDEARHGVNAYEMLRENNFIANFYAGNPDYYNLKPPISYYVVILGYKLFGFNTLGLRFFSALSYVISAVIISIYLKNHHGKLESLISLFIMTTFVSLFVIHCARSGDADAVFLLFYTLAIISLFKTKENSNWIYLTGFMFALMFLTKSWHAGTLVPIVFFYLLLTKGFKKIGAIRLCLFFAVSLAPIAIWALARYAYDGLTFLRPMVEYDLLSRTNTAIENNGRPFYYYFVDILQYASPALLASIAVMVCNKKAKQKFSDEDVGCIISFLCIMLFFSVSKTKICWYVFPIVIPLTISASKIVKFIDGKKIQKITLAAFMFIFAVFMGISFILPVNYDRSNNNVQTFLSKTQISGLESKEFYYDANNKWGSDWSQADLLAVELKWDGYTKNGGWNAFVSDTDAYIIIDSNKLSEDRLLIVDVLFESDGISLCKHK